MAHSPLMLYVADTFWRRLLGLFAVGELRPDCGLCITPCNAIHTFGLASDIDVVFLDEAGRLKRCVHRLAPWRMTWCRSARSVIELPGGYCESNPDYMQAIVNALNVRCRSSRQIR